MDDLKKDDLKKVVSFRLDPVIVDYIKKIGEGNRTRGVEILYECYRNNGHGTVVGKNEDIETLFLDSIMLPSNTKQQEGYIIILNDYFRSGCCRTTIQHYKYLLGLTGMDKGAAKRFFKRLVGSKYLVERDFLFRPAVRPRNNVPIESLKKLMEKYKESLQVDVDNDDILTD